MLIFSVSTLSPLYKQLTLTRVHRVTACPPSKILAGRPLSAVQPTETTSARAGIIAHLAQEAFVYDGGA